MPRLVCTVSVFKSYRFERELCRARARPPFPMRESIGSLYIYERFSICCEHLQLRRTSAKSCLFAAAQMRFIYIYICRQCNKVAFADRNGKNAVAARTFVLEFIDF